MKLQSFQLIIKFSLLLLLLLLLFFDYFKHVIDDKNRKYFRYFSDILYKSFQ